MATKIHYCTCHKSKCTCMYAHLTKSICTLTHSYLHACISHIFACVLLCFTVSFDEYPASSWTLSRQPVDLLTSLRQHYLNSIIQQVQGSADPQVYNRAATLVKYLCGLVRCELNVCLLCV